MAEKKSEKAIKWFSKYRLVLLGVACLILVGCCSRCWYGKEDSVIEEVSEKVIEEVTGVDIDLTPGSPERTQF